MQARKTDHITPILRSLHWLPIHARIDYKIGVLCHNFFSDLSPYYLSSCLIVYAPGRNLRSASDNRILCVPRTKSKYGDRSFSCYAPKFWNSLPQNIRHIQSTSSFKSALKTFLFRKYLEWWASDPSLDTEIRLWWHCDFIIYLWLYINNSIYIYFTHHFNNNFLIGLISKLLVKTFYISNQHVTIFNQWLLS